MKVDRTTERYFQLLDAVGQAVIATDASGLIALWSRAAESLYGWRADEVIGRDVLEITPMDVSRARGAEIMQVLSRGELWSGEFEVRTRRGKSLKASVTDVPLLSDDQGVAGVIGVSAPSRAPTTLQPLLKRFKLACNKVWPGQIFFEVSISKKARVAATEPHMIQLLALLILLHAEALDRGAEVEVIVGSAEKSPFTDFGLAFASSAAYVRIARRDAQPTFSVLRSLAFSAEPTKYTASLVRMVGGMLIAGTAPGRASAMHLFLPLESE